MGMKEELKRPYSTYDVFGYFAPGVIVVLGILVHTKVFLPATYDTIQRDLVVPYWPQRWYEFAAYLFLGVLLIYVLGHLVASISSAIVDSLLVKRMHGYPYQRVFQRYFSKVNIREYKPRQLAQTSFALFVVSLVLLAIPGVTLRIILGLIGAGVLVLVVRKITSRSGAFRGDRASRFLFWAVYGPLSVFRWLYRHVSGLLADTFRMDEPFSERFEKNFFHVFHRCFEVPHGNQEDGSTLGSNTYWLPYAYIARHCPSNLRNITGWLNLYSFARNTSVAFFLLYLYDAILARVPSLLQGPRTCAWPITTGALAMAFLLRFYYLYYKYYSKFIFRAFFVLAANAPPRGADAQPATGVDAE